MEIKTATKRLGFCRVVYLIIPGSGNWDNVFSVGRLGDKMMDGKRMKIT